MNSYLCKSLNIKYIQYRYQMGYGTPNRRCIIGLNPDTTCKRVLKCDITIILSC